MSEELLVTVKNKIYDFRGQKVMLDSDLAEYYGVTTKQLNQAVQRNLYRFPEDFMFQLSNEEWFVLRSQIVTSNSNQVKRRFNPYVFTEKGAWTISFILKSTVAAQKGIALIRVLEQLRDAVQLQMQVQSQIVPESVQHQLTSPTSIINHFHGSVVLQQGNNNSQVNHLTRESIVMELTALKQEETNMAMVELMQTLADQLSKKEEKSAILKTFSLIQKGSTAASALTKFCLKVAPFIHHLPW